MVLEEVSIALDWTLNSNHTGFIVAKALGYYSEEGLNVTFIEPGTPYVPPAERLRDGTATFAIAPSETAISSCSQTGKPRLQAVAALLAEDTSAIVTLKKSGLDSPKLLEGRKYASYGARYEGRIVQQLIRNAGGTGEYREVPMPALDIWAALLKGEADATWVFLGHEGVQAEMDGVDLNIFRLADYGIPYGFTPVLVANPEMLRQRQIIVKAFLQATSRGYQVAAADPQRAAAMLVEESQGALNPDFARKSQEITSKQYLSSSGQWGFMEPGRWQTFLKWLHDTGLLTDATASRAPVRLRHSPLLVVEGHWECDRNLSTVERVQCEVEGKSASLDDLRSGKAGTLLELSDPRLAEVFTNEYLPWERQA